MLKETQERKTRLDIIAPFDGTVVAKYAEVGEYVPIGSQIVDIVSTGRIDARIMVPEESLPLLEVGDELDIIVDALDLELQGKVFSINAQGSVGSRTFPVRVELDDLNGKLLPGMGVSVFVPVTRESTELLVPRDAVLTKPDGSTIWVVKPKEVRDGQQEPLSTLVAQPIPVRLLSHTRDAYALSCERESDKEHVIPGTKVVTEGLERLIPGSVVRVDPDASPLAPVPGMYRSGQQIVERLEP
jgi:multidrug efflux pump subunit AcrA (membrane-fusion protein)